MDVNAESSPLQPANRDGGIDQDWAGDDQDWRDWYVTLAENDDAPIARLAKRLDSLLRAEHGDDVAGSLHRP